MGVADSDKIGAPEEFEKYAENGTLGICAKLRATPPGLPLLRLNSQPRCRCIEIKGRMDCLGRVQAGCEIIDSKGKQQLLAS